MDTEVVVVGAGIMGVATAHELALRGRDVLVLEQFRIGHKRGSSHGATRIFRLAYPEPEWVRLSQGALAGWRDLEAESGTEIVWRLGLVELVRDLEQSSQKALEMCGIAYRVLEADEASALFSLTVPRGFSALLQPEAGIVYAERAHAAFRTGLDIQEEVRAVSLTANTDSVRVETTKGALTARALVVTAGAWARALLATAGIDLQVQPTRETVAYFALGAREPPPAVAEFAAEGRGHAFYGVFDPGYGLKVGLNGSGPLTDPEVDGGPDRAIVEKIASWAATRLPLGAPEPLHVETCLYTNTADESFVLEGYGRIVVGSACSGHGFKFAPVVGRRLAELACEAIA